MVKQLENWHYNVVSLVNVSHHIIETKSIKYNNDIHSDGNLFFLSVPGFQSSAIDLNITNCMCNADERT